MFKTRILFLVVLLVFSMNLYGQKKDEPPKIPLQGPWMGLTDMGIIVKEINIKKEQARLEAMKQRNDLEQEKMKLLKMLPELANSKEVEKQREVIDISRKLLEIQFQLDNIELSMRENEIQIDREFMEEMHKTIIDKIESLEGDQDLLKKYIDMIKKPGKK